MQVIPSSMIMANSHYICFRLAFSMSHTTSIIGNGVALNIPYLFNEINDIVETWCAKAEDSGL